MVKIYYWFLFCIALVSKSLFFLILILVIIGGLVYFFSAQIKVTDFIISPFNSQKWLPPVGTNNPGRLDETGTKSANYHLFVRLGNVISVTGFLFLFAVLPFGRVSLSLSQLHPGLSEFPLLVVATPELGLLIVVVCVFLFFLGQLPRLWSSESGWSKIRELALLFSLLFAWVFVLPGLVICSGSLNLFQIVKYQLNQGWLLFYQPLLAVLYLIIIFFFHRRFTFYLEGLEPEFSVNRKISFFTVFTQYLVLFAQASLFTVLFLGGWVPPVSSLFPPVIDGFFPGFNLFWHLGWFGLKTGLIIYLLVRLATFYPRLKYPQLMNLCWQYLIPLTWCNLLLAGLLKLIFPVSVFYWVSVQLVWLVIIFLSLVSGQLYPDNTNTVKLIEPRRARSGEK